MKLKAHKKEMGWYASSVTPVGIDSQYFRTGQRILEAFSPTYFPTKEELVASAKEVGFSFEGEESSPEIDLLKEKLPAVKALRDFCQEKFGVRMGLKEGKDFIEVISKDLTWERDLKELAKKNPYRAKEIVGAL